MAVPYQMAGGCDRWRASGFTGPVHLKRILRALNISKLDAARRQLETAINLYFHEGDVVSIHTLASAAHEIVQNITKEKGGKPTLKESWNHDIKPEFLKEFSKKLRDAQTFLEHSRRDGHQSIELEPFRSDIVMLDACWSYRRVTNERLPVFGTFEVWAAITWGKRFLRYQGLNLADPLIVKWANSSRQEFFNTFLPIAYAAIVTSPSLVPSD